MEKWKAPILTWQSSVDPNAMATRRSATDSLARSHSLASFVGGDGPGLTIKAIKLPGYRRISRMTPKVSKEM